MKSKPSLPASLACRVRVKEDIVSRTVHGEEVLLDLGSGVYFGLNETGTSIWKKLQEGLALSQIASGLTREFAVPRERAEKDVLALVKRLAGKQLVELG